MLEVRLSTKARRDLKQIWLYGRREWGEAQADAYALALSAAIDRLREHPSIGLNAALVLANGRRWKVGSHHIYYLLDGATVRIIRILSAQQDPARQFR